jgi:riboflavin kinase/FMN adenylyltransferase
MDIARGLQNVPAHPEDSCVTFGAFDGVHLGHQRLLLRTVELARTRNWRSVTLTFEPHPDKVLHPDRELLLLSDFEEKAALIEQLGIDRLIVANFDEAMAFMPAGEFLVELLEETLGAKCLVVGPQVSFGYQASGNILFLEQRAPQRGIALEVVETVTCEGVPASSTNIRTLLTEGAVERAARLLGRHYRLAGTVVKGAGRGRDLGFPTANLNVRTEKLWPRDGVYAGWADVKGTGFPAVINVGRRPTFQETIRVVEAHIPGFEHDLYGAELALDFVSRLRDERQFSRPEELRSQIERDCEKARAILSGASCLSGAAPQRPAER